MQYLLHARLIKAVLVKIELIPGLKARHLKNLEKNDKTQGKNSINNPTKLSFDLYKVNQGIFDRK